MAKATQKDIFAQRVESITALLKSQLDSDTAKVLAEQLLKGVDGGSEIPDFNQWKEQRLIPQLVWLDENDYARAITRALPQSLKMSASDFGGTRQRDLGQLWTDTARGFMGEIAVKKFLEERMNTVIEPDISTDKTIDEYIATDIKTVSRICGSDCEPRPPKINVSIKTGKFNARWLDEYSVSKTKAVDALILVRIGTSREHFIGFLKQISFLGTKLFPLAEELGELSSETRAKQWEVIPSFQQIPAYISGFLLRGNLSLPVHSIEPKLSGKKEETKKHKC